MLSAILLNIPGRYLEKQGVMKNLKNGMPKIMIKGVMELIVVTETVDMS